MAAIVLLLPPRVVAYIGTLPPRRRGRANMAAVDEGVRLLKAPASRWPVDTGRSKRAFYRSGTGINAKIRNPTSYASYVEAKTSKGRRTLAAGVRQMLQAARDAAALTRRQQTEAAQGQFIRFVDNLTLFERENQLRPRLLRGVASHTTLAAERRALRRRALDQAMEARTAARTAERRTAARTAARGGAQRGRSGGDRR